MEKAMSNRQNQSLDVLMPLSDGCSGEARPPDAWMDSDIRRLLTSSSSASFCPLDRVQEGSLDYTEHPQSHEMAHRVCREKWRTLVRKLKTQHQKVQHHHEVDDDASDDSFSFQRHDIQSSPIDMEMETSSLNPERRLNGDGQSVISVTSQDCPLENEQNHWSWRESNCADVSPWETGMDCHPTAPKHAGRFIMVKWGDVTRKIGIDGSGDAIKDAIRSVFRLRTKRTFWVEDENGVGRGFDRTMPQATYTLHTV
ncbi:trihelix transcription factor GT-1-like [Aristolochia californica]|uniref:trihelix transcription factor GT-1-like n=1 Tax=Aristolochia californica TaxID=171875 RepID=UPI0035E3AAF7